MKRYAVVGTGGRSVMYIDALSKDYKDCGKLVAFCDSNRTRMGFYNRKISELYSAEPVPQYMATDFDKMIKETKPDVVIVTSIDRTHHKYICRAMELGCDVISEKPMTIDAEKCQMIVDTKKKTGRNLIVTFNYRYSPKNTKVKEILKEGKIGKILSIHFEWLLSTSHGADYFRRWHRDKRNNGGLLVHKSTHHFDLVNWWIDSYPETVFAFGDLMFYGKANAEERGITEFYSRARGSEIAKKDPFALKINDSDEVLKGLYFDAEHEDHYYKDQSVFGDGISTEDTLGLLIKYKNKAIMTYSLNAHCPWEGYRVAFNGTKGRLEFNVVEEPYVEGIENLSVFGAQSTKETSRVVAIPDIILQTHWGKAEVISYKEGREGGHGGGDVRLLSDIFRGVKDNSLGHSAGYVDGAWSILTGIAGNISIATGMPVKTENLIKF